METKAFEVCGHSRPLGYLERMKKRGMPVSSFLFSGAEEVGKKTAALRFVSGLVCVGKNNPVTGCGVCERCQAVLNGSYTDFAVLEGKEEIGIGDIRELKRRLSLHAYAGSFRGVIIDDAHRLTADAQGALLKILEEPASATLFFLITSRPHFLFETIRSRLLEVSFGSVADDEMRRWAVNNFNRAAEMDDLLTVAGGRPGRLKRFLENPESFKEEKIKLSKFEPLFKKPLVDQFLFSERLASDDEEETRDFLRFIIGKARNKLFAGGIKNGEIIEKLHTMLDMYFKLETTNVNQRLLVDSFIMEAGNL